jgi:hypothetical protein
MCLQINFFIQRRYLCASFVQKSLNHCTLLHKPTAPSQIQRDVILDSQPYRINKGFVGYIVISGIFSFQDCIFDGVSCPDVDAVYANSKICGNFADNYPSPFLTARYT